jgi:hypothetical protein
LGPLKAKLLGRVKNLEAVIGAQIVDLKAQLGQYDSGSNDYKVIFANIQDDENALDTVNSVEDEIDEATTEVELDYVISLLEKWEAVFGL